MHGEFLTMDDAKMAKSAGNIIRVADLPDLGYEPLVFRHLALMAHYRSKLDFTADAMHAAASGLERLRRAVTDAPDDANVDLGAEPMASYRDRFVAAIADDLGLPRALAVAHEVASAVSLEPTQRRALLLDFDRVLGLSLDAPAADAPPLPAEALALLERRAAAREARDWATADALRGELAALGVEVRDTADGQEATRRRDP
jgi:cysteinyl-tRNA synthetase